MIGHCGVARNLPEGLNKSIATNVTVAKKVRAEDAGLTPQGGDAQPDGLAECPFL